MISRFARVLAASALVATLSACARPAPIAQPEWRTIGELAHPRAYASAIALSNGKILVVGGLNNDDPAITNYESELIDPLTGKVTVLPEKLLGRLHQSITVGWDEMVVVAGGVEWRYTFWNPVSRVDVYVPSLRRWVTGRSLGEARSDHAATALHDGRVLITGGNANTKILGSTEIYDPRADEWLSAAPMPAPRTQHSATTLIDGRVLVTGGIGAGGASTGTTFLYDPRTDVWSDGPQLTIARHQHIVVGLPNGDVLLAGGDGPASGTSEVYDRRAARFVPSGTLAYPRMVAQGAALPDGRVVLSGGLPPRMREFLPLRTVELWNPATGLWRELPPAPTPRAWGSIVIVGGVVYQIGGTGDGESAYRTIERLALN